MIVAFILSMSIRFMMREYGQRRHFRFVENIQIFCPCHPQHFWSHYRKSVSDFWPTSGTGRDWQKNQSREQEIFPYPKKRTKIDFYFCTRACHLDCDVRPSELLVELHGGCFEFFPRMCLMIQQAVNQFAGCEPIREWDGDGME